VLAPAVETEPVWFRRELGSRDSVNYDVGFQTDLETLRFVGYMISNTSAIAQSGNQRKLIYKCGTSLNRSGVSNVKVANHGLTSEYGG